MIKMQDLLNAYQDACVLQQQALDNKDKKEAVRQALIKTHIRAKIKISQEKDKQEMLGKFTEVK